MQNVAQIALKRIFLSEKLQKLPLLPDPQTFVHGAVKFHQFAQHNAKTKVVSSKEFLMFSSSTSAPLPFSKILVKRLIFVYHRNKTMINVQCAYCSTVRQEIVGAIYLFHCCNFDRFSATNCFFGKL